MTNKLAVTIIQPNVFWEDKDKNKKMFDKIIGKLSQTTDLIILPEMFGTGFSMRPSLLAETMNGPTVSWMAEKARQNNAVITGTSHMPAIL